MATCWNMLSKYGNLNLLFKKKLKENKWLSQNLTTLMHFSHKNALHELNCIPFFLPRGNKNSPKTKHWSWPLCTSMAEETRPFIKMFHICSHSQRPIAGTWSNITQAWNSRHSSPVLYYNTLPKLNKIIWKNHMKSLQLLFDDHVVWNGCIKWYTNSIIHHASWNKLFDLQLHAILALK